jgi:hypothetical protein
VKGKLCHIAKHYFRVSAKAERRKRSRLNIRSFQAQGLCRFQERINHFGVTASYSLPEGIAGETGKVSKLNDLCTVNNSPMCNQLNQRARSKFLIRVVMDEGLLLVKRISKASRK